MSMARPVVRSYKKVLNFAPASTGAGIQTDFPLVTGVDGLSPGSTGVTDATVPTGSIVKYIEIQHCDSNITASAAFTHLCIQYLMSTQVALSPNGVGGNPQRNQVLYQKMYIMGQNQNSNHVMRFKIPKKYQRVREGQQWFLSTICSNSHVQGTQVIYKLYT